jgi:hypothetical protein
MALKVAIKILNGGNKNAQMEFLKVFKKLEDQNIINTLIKVIKECFDGIESTMVIKNNNNMKSLLLGKEKTLFHDSSLQKYDVLLKKLTSMMKFFQLLCEGHNAELQNYLRVGSAKDSEDSVKGIQRNFISFISTLFGSYIKFFNNESTKVGLMMLEFMIEAVQGPCRGNQRQMIDSKVLNYCKDFLNDLNSNSSSLRMKGFYIDNAADKEIKEEHTDMLNSLFANTIKLLLSI